MSKTPTWILSSSRRILGQHHGRSQHCWLGAANQKIGNIQENYVLVNLLLFSGKWVQAIFACMFINNLSFYVKFEQNYENELLLCLTSQLSIIIALMYLFLQCPKLQGSLQNRIISIFPQRAYVLFKTAESVVFKPAFLSTVCILNIAAENLKVKLTESKCNCCLIFHSFSIQ